MKLLAHMMRQDDPRKCTAAKLVHMRMAYPVRRIPRNSIVLNPYSRVSLCAGDRDLAKNSSVTVVDCSWEKTDAVFRKTRGIGRRLPALLAGNPTNYSKLGKLSSAEALAAACTILGHTDLASAIMNKFKWGHTFLELNSEPLKEYAAANNPEEIERIELEYWPGISLSSGSSNTG